MTLATNQEIGSVSDLKDKVIAAQAISDFAGGQVQFYVMKEAGLNYIMGTCVAYACRCFQTSLCISHFPVDSQ